MSSSIRQALLQDIFGLLCSSEAIKCSTKPHALVLFRKKVCACLETLPLGFTETMLCMWTEYLLWLAVPCKKIPWDNKPQVLSQGGKGAKKQITILLIPGRDYQNYTCAGPICSLLLYNPIYLWCFWCPPPGRRKTCLWKAAKHAKKRGRVRVQSTGDGHFSGVLCTAHTEGCWGNWPHSCRILRASSLYNTHLMSKCMISHRLGHPPHALSCLVQWSETHLKAFAPELLAQM